MPTDDDYGRRERLLLHQHPISQYGSSSSPVPGSTAVASGSVGSQIGAANPSDSYKPQQQQQQQQQQQHHQPQQQQQQQQQQQSSSSTSVSTSGQDRYQTDAQGQGSDHDYGGRDRLSGLDRHDKSTDKPSLDEFPKPCGDGRSLQSSCERFGHYQSQDRFVQSGLHHQYASSSRSGTSGQTLSQSVLSDRFPRFGELGGLHGEQRLSLVPSERYQQSVGGGGGDGDHHLSGGNEYANSSILVSGCATSPFSSETFPSPPSPAPANDRFVPPPPLSPSPSEKYASTQSLAGYPAADRILPPGSPSAKYGGGTAPASPMPVAERFSSADRLLANQQSSAGLHECKDQQRYAAASDRLLSGSSPVLGTLQVSLQGDRAAGYTAGKESAAARYGAISADRLLSASPIHAPVPERFASKSTDRYIGESPVYDRYHRPEAASAVHHDRYSTISSTAEKFLANAASSEASHQRYTSTERSLQVSSSGSEQRRLYADRGVETVCQKYQDNRPSGSPASADFGRYSSYQEVGTGGQSRYVTATDRFNDAAVQRCAQSRTTDRFCVSADRFLASSSPGHDARHAADAASRYTVSGSSTERLLSTTSSSSSSSTDTIARYHSSYTNTTATQSSTNDRFASISPTPEAAATVLRSGTSAAGSSSGGYQTAAKTGIDKYLQVSKSVQSYASERYGGATSSEQFDRLSQDRYDRFAGSVAGDRFVTSTGTPDRFHSAADRYSPARAADKYLSLPKPKDRYTGRITPISSCGTSAATSTATDRAYAGANATASYVPPTAHTPVERYVPQPPPEVLYPDRYVDRYVPPSAHTPTDRYVPTNDPGDPYMRRDLGFHHHYRLPPPAGYPYHQSHFRLRGFAYASPGRLGGSPGSSSSSSSASNQRDGFSMSPLLRPKVRASAVEFPTTSASGVARHVCTNPPSCCNELAGSGRSCCQAIRRSLPPGALPSIPTQTSWQPSPGSGTTGTSTVSSNGPDAENGQSISLYPVGSSGPSQADPVPVTPVTTTATMPMVTPGTVTGSGSGPNISRSASAPSAPKPHVQITSSASNPGSQRPRLRRNMSRTEAVRNYIKRETAQFFGVDEESETAERQRWLDRRRRMASRKYGALVPEHRPPDPDITRDVPDTTDLPEGVTLRRWQQPVRRKDSVARMTLSGLHYVVENTISTWKKWGPGDSGPGGRISGSVCGLDPKFCDAPASIAPYEWPDDITKWPICRKTNPFNQRFSRNGSQRGTGSFPVGKYKHKMAEHMVCEVIGHPCCIGIHGMCRITTKEYCDFVHGYFHEEASLCSQVECLHDVCGMIPFLHPEWPDQFYRLFTTIFLHAGILHLFITLLVQYFLMRDLEKLTGSLRIALIYFIGALAGNLASAIFVPYRAEVGPAGAHFALLATLIVEVLHCWPMLKHPRRALTKLIFILLSLLVLGILPWVDNYAHLFGFIFGFLAAYALMPFISFGHYDRRRKIWLIWICMILIVVLFTLLLTLFYNVPVYECEVCKLFNCIPFTRDFCASQNINFKQEESV
ncbi:rhomboid-5 [Augochlora pura]